MTPDTVLHQLQGLLAGIYDLPLGYDVRDFLFTEREWLPEALCDSGADEQMLVLEQDSAAYIGLFIDAEVLRRLAAADPVQALHSGNLADCCTALEGVSHFMYLVWNAGYDRPVSVLELELQAEIDKYVGMLWLLRAQDPARFPQELHRLLFERARIDPRLASGREWLYREASDYAARFCRWLEPHLRHRAAPARREALCELRRFYRLSHERKRAHIRGRA